MDFALRRRYRNNLAYQLVEKLGIRKQELVVTLSQRVLTVRISAFAVVLCFNLCAGYANAEEFTNFLGMKFISIPAGNYHMGSASAELDVMFNEMPQHKVNVPGFQIMNTEVTLGQFKRYIIASDRTDLVTDEFMDANAHGDDAPVVYVSWNDIKTFLFWLNKNKPASDRGIYRLPSESEWEFSCRAGTKDPYCGNRTPSTVAWHAAVSGSHQQPVGKKEANAFGLYDMSGNAREWVEDCYHDSYENAPSDGSAWLKACMSNAHVLRGGSWKEEFQKARVTDRISAPALSRSDTIGFRVVRTLP